MRKLWRTRHDINISSNEQRNQNRTNSQGKKFNLGCALEKFRRDVVKKREEKRKENEISRFGLLWRSMDYPD